MEYLIILIITILIFTNAVTDAPNAIATLVGTKVMEFKKAAKLSAIFNLIGIIVIVVGPVDMWKTGLKLYA